MFGAHAVPIPPKDKAATSPAVATRSATNFADRCVAFAPACRRLGRILPATDTQELGSGVTPKQTIELLA
jgi:hypothetical protein